ncbi:MAG TPA: NB-ARC domain-containing protein [Burkholderiaceae bacterium]|jgi:predicted ATPase/class 3 adenylate cyclase|nr:NB-ARC domain-containing protein [Burkholderiaceae bacterium]
MSDVRALLLTDVVDSTRLAEKLGDAALADLWAAHDRAARDLLPTWRGREIDKTDGMLLLFDSAADAVGYALAYHRALAGQSTTLWARAGLHVGPVLLRENDAADVARGAKPIEVDGLAKSVAARVMSVARGGQTLLSAEAREALGGTSLEVQSHGHWMVKGVTDPVELFQVGEAGTRFQAPADSDKVFRVIRAGDWWMPVREVPNNLPQQGTSFVGREREMDEVRTRLGNARLLTLLGMGGLGKTRLSLQVAADVMHEYPDGVWFVDLAPIRDPALVASEAAQALGVREEPDRPLLQTLCAFLKARRVLLILDNCEHLIEPAADLAHAVVKAAPFVHVLASSRQALRIPGEHVYPILPLPLPRAGDDMHALRRSPAVQLFVDRARSHKPSFALNEREAPAVAALVTRLEGIPLALELAAARVRSLSVADINTRLKDRYKVLTGGARVHDERQQTLRALVDWSYELLTESEQTAFARFAVFAGGFDLSAAEAVCGADPLLADDVLDLIESLIEKSLVMPDDCDEGMRYRMLETIRDYAHEKLEHGGELDATAARHCDYYFAIAKSANQGLEGPEQADWVWRVEAELDNLRAAVALALSGGVDAVIAVKFAVALAGFWMLRGYATEGRSVVRAALDLPAVQSSDVARAWALYAGSRLAENQSDLAEALKMLEICLELRRGLDNPVEIAATLSTLSLVRLQTGDAAGAEVGEREALQIFVGLGDRVGEAIGLLHLGQIAIHRGDLDTGRSLLEQCLAITRAIKSMDIEGECELHLGEAAVDSGAPDDASQHFKRSLIVCREGADKPGEAKALWRLGQVDLGNGDLVSARARLGDALRSFNAFGMRAELLGCLETCAALAKAENRVATAARLTGAIELARERLVLARPPKAAEHWSAQVDALCKALPADEFEMLRNEGRQWQIDDALRQALSAQGDLVTA